MEKYEILSGPHERVRLHPVDQAVMGAARQSKWANWHGLCGAALLHVAMFALLWRNMAEAVSPAPNDGISVAMVFSAPRASESHAVIATPPVASLPMPLPPAQPRLAPSFAAPILPAPPIKKQALHHVPHAPVAIQSRHTRPLYVQPLAQPAASPQPGISAAPKSDAPVAPARAPQAAAISAAWRLALATWLAAHKTYPEAARAAGETGRVILRFTINHAGQVTDVMVVKSTGSPRLDQAALALLRNARLPALPPDTVQDSVTVAAPLDYRLTD